MELGATYSQFALLRNDKNFVKNFRIKIVIRINTKIGLLLVKRPTSQKMQKEFVDNFLSYQQNVLNYIIYHNDRIH